MAAEVPFDQELKAALPLEGHAVARWEIRVGAALITIWGLRDAADLLDQPEFAREFVEQDRAPYWAQLWPAAVMLAETLWDMPLGDRRRALELGCGLGLGSIAAALRGWHVTATDYDERALRLTAMNARANGAVLAKCELLDWARCPASRRFDLVLAADILYQRQDHEAILAAIDRLLAPHGLAMIVDPNRVVAREFPEQVRAAGLLVTTAPRFTQQVTGQRVDGTVLSLRRA
jgi:predicted nicotinamide N-methyase